MDTVWRSLNLKNGVAGVRLRVQILDCCLVRAERKAPTDVFVQVALHGLARRTGLMDPTATPSFNPLDSIFDFLVFLQVVDEIGATLTIDVIRTSTDAREQVIGSVMLNPREWFPLEAQSPSASFQDFNKPETQPSHHRLLSADGREIGSVLVKLGFASPPLREAANYGETFEALLKCVESCPIRWPVEPSTWSETVRSLLCSVKDSPQSRRPDIPTLPLLRSIKGVDVISVHPAGTRVVRWNPGVLVKYGSFVIPTEIDTQRFVLQHTSIPTPRVLCIPSDPDTFSFLMMEEIDGVPLSACLHRMSDEDLDNIAAQLRDYITQLSRIELPSKKLGQLNGEPYANQNFGNAWISPPVAYESARDLNNHWAELLRPCSAAYWLADLMSKLMLDAPIVLCHGDLTPQNILIKDRSTIVSIVDWGSSAVYPAYYELAGMTASSHMPSKWRHIVESIFPIGSPMRDAAEAVNAIWASMSVNY